MTLAQDLTTIIIFWAIIGGLGASLLLPSMQYPHPRQLRGRRSEEGLRPGGAAAAIAAAGTADRGFITTYLSYRVALSR